MNVSPALVFQPSTESPVASGARRAAQATPPSIPGTAPSGENGSAQVSSPRSTPVQDVVKVQLEPPGEIVVYQFVDQQGTIVLQVPPQQLLNLAQQISQELARKPPSQAASPGGNDNGH